MLNLNSAPSVTLTVEHQDIDPALLAQSAHPSGGAHSQAIVNAVTQVLQSAGVQASVSVAGPHVRATVEPADLKRISSHALVMWVSDKPAEATLLLQLLSDHGDGTDQLQLGECLTKTGRYDQVPKYLDPAGIPPATNDVIRAEWLTWVATAYLMAGNTAEALRWFEAAVAVAPHAGDPLARSANGLALTYRALGRVADAERVVATRLDRWRQQLAGLETRDELLLAYNLAVLRHTLGDPVGAAEALSPLLIRARKLRKADVDFRAVSKLNDLICHHRPASFVPVVGQDSGFLLLVLP